MCKSFIYIHLHLRRINIYIKKINIESKVSSSIMRPWFYICITSTNTLKIFVVFFGKSHLPHEFSGSTTVATRWQKYGNVIFKKKKKINSFWRTIPAECVKYISNTWFRTIWVMTEEKLFFCSF